PGGPGEGVEGRCTVDEYQVVVLLDVGQRFFQLPDVSDARMGPVEVDGRRAADHDVDLAGATLRPSARGDGGANDLLLGGGENIRHIQVSGDVDVHAGGDIGLRVKVDDKGAEALGEGRGDKSERDSGLSDSSLEGAHAENIHNKKPYLHYSQRTQSPKGPPFFLEDPCCKPRRYRHPCLQGGIR